MRYLSFFVLFLILFGGCAGMPYQLAKMDQEQLKTVTYYQLIDALWAYKAGNQLISNEAISWGLITKEDVGQISRREIKIGMSEQALIASWGKPTKINKTVGNLGVHKQYIYGSYSKYEKPKYVYIDNGKVTSWQVSE